MGGTESGVDREGKGEPGEEREGERKRESDR